VPEGGRDRRSVLSTRWVISPCIPSLMYRHHRRCPGASHRRLAPAIIAAIAMLADPHNEHRLGDRGNDTHGASAERTTLQIDIEYPAPALHPAHRGCEANPYRDVAGPLSGLSSDVDMASGVIVRSGDPRDRERDIQSAGTAYRQAILGCRCRGGNDTPRRLKPA